MEDQQESLPPKTDFLQAIGLVFICLFGFLGLITALFGLIFKLLSLAQEEDKPDIIQEFFKNMGYPGADITSDFILLFLWCLLGFVLISLGISIGIYFKQKWARIPFISIASLILVAALSLVVWIWSIPPQKLPEVHGEGAEFASGIQSTMNVISRGGNIANTFYLLAASIALGFVIRKLLRPEILAEFEKK